MTWSIRARNGAIEGKREGAAELATAELEREKRISGAEREKAGLQRSSVLYTIIPSEAALSCVQRGLYLSATVNKPIAAFAFFVAKQ